MKDIRCRNCFNFHRGWCEKVADSPDPDMKRECSRYRKLLNLDVIHRMNPAELSKFVEGVINDCPPEFRAINEEGILSFSIESFWDWLSRPVKDQDTEEEKG